MSDPLTLQPQAFEPVKSTRPKHGYTETDLSRSIGQYLDVHREVVSVTRVLTGTFLSYSIRDAVLDLIGAIKSPGDLDGKIYGLQAALRRIARGADKGTLDRFVTLRGGRYAWIEVKMPGQYPTPDQREFIARERAAGGIADVARSLGDIDTILSGGRVWTPQKKTPGEATNQAPGR